MRPEKNAGPACDQDLPSYLQPCRMVVAGTFHYRTDATGSGNFYDYGILAYLE